MVTKQYWTGQWTCQTKVARPLAPTAKGFCMARRSSAFLDGGLLWSFVLFLFFNNRRYIFSSSTFESNRSDFFHKQPLIYFLLGHGSTVYARFQSLHCFLINLDLKQPGNFQLLFVHKNFSGFPVFANAKAEFVEAHRSQYIFYTKSSLGSLFWRTQNANFLCTIRYQIYILRRDRTDRCRSTKFVQGATTVA